MGLGKNYLIITCWYAMSGGGRCQKDVCIARRVARRMEEMCEAHSDGKKNTAENK